MDGPEEKIEDAATTPLAPDKPNVGAHPAKCPVVGLGASAGGLEAFQTFFAAAPADAGLAYVLVQHLDPNHESMLAELLSRRTEMSVQQVTDGMDIEPNHVYLIPPNASLIVKEARLRLSDFSEPRGFRRPIDVFFRSLAVDQGANAACVVLSGTGGDGSEGLRAVKEAGGLTLVQEPEAAKYDGMPKSAVATGLVDKVLGVSEMPATIRAYFDRGRGEPSVFNLPDVSDFLLKVCALMRNRLGHDFSQYKRSTMLRRVQRRIQVVGALTGEEYLQRLETNDTEANLLFRDLLINVTSFFRDAEAFDFLRRDVVPQLLKDKGAADTLRIWTPGCSSGEEAYSLAILIAEAMVGRRDRPTVQIFATDIDEPMLHKARLARYPHVAAKDVPLELLDRYFYAQDDEYVLTQSIRDMVRVSNHNMIKDPPFSRCDMIVCRNLLIYLNASLQQRLIPVFHYALRQDGWLFLGSAENIASRSDIFDTVNPANKIYRRRGTMRQSVAMPLHLDSGSPRNSAHPVRDIVAAERGDPVTRRIMDRYAPAHVVVDNDNTVIRASSRTGRYFELPTGSPSSRVTDLARRGLRSAVRSVLETARKSGKRAIKKAVRIDAETDTTFADVVAEPLNETSSLLIFLEVAADDEISDSDIHLDGENPEDRLQEIEEELAETQTKLRTTVEELETSNEELKSSNEEMMSMNEELQSTNEELATVNEELKNKVDQLAFANSDMQNFIESTQIPTIFLDGKLRIRNYTPATRRLFRFQDQDKGRLFSDVVSRTDHNQLEDMARKVLDTGQAAEEEVTVDSGKESYVLRVLPYLDSHDAIDGVILVFSDVTKIRETQADLALNVEIARQRSEEIETLYKTATVGMALVDRDRRFMKINQQFAGLNGEPIEAHSGKTLGDMNPILAAKIEQPIADVFTNGTGVSNQEVTIKVNGNDPQDFLVDVYPYEQHGAPTAVGIVMKDVTAVHQLESELRRLMDELQHRVKNTLATVASIVNQTVATNADREDLIDTLKKRIGALAATHHLLTSREWRDASLHEILEAELSPYGQRDSMSLSGPKVPLPPKHALTLTMTIHELTTNAAKYGALAHPNTCLVIDWSINTDASGRKLVFDWTESGVPGVDPSKARKSFGTKLIKNAVVHDLHGECDYVLRDDGVSCSLRVPF